MVVAGKNGRAIFFIECTKLGGASSFFVPVALGRCGELCLSQNENPRERHSFFGDARFSRTSAYARNLSNPVISVRTY